MSGEDAEVDYLRSLLESAGDNRVLREAAEAVLAERLGHEALEETPEPVTYVKPPLGALPRFIVVERRLDDLGGAIKRYQDAGLEPLPEWLDEQEELLVCLAWLRRSS